MNPSDVAVRIITGFILLLPIACTVGPDYVKPTPLAVMPSSYKEQDGWKVAQPQDGVMTERWWEIYHDPVLNSLVEQVAVSNHNVAAAEAQFRQARAIVQAAGAGSSPKFSAGAAATRVRTSDNLGAGGRSGSTATDFQLPLDATWELDVWGKIRRGVEASQANAQASAADLAAATLSAQAELVGDYFQLRIVDAQKRLLDATLEVYRASLNMTNNRYAVGVAAKTEVLQAETQLKSTAAQAIDLGVQRAQLEHAIALLMGKPPAGFTLPSTPVTLEVPSIELVIPSELLERRPDIASAERRMAAANAQIGVAQAAWYPTVQLNASGGFSASTLVKLLDWPSRVWSIGPSVSAALFDGGLRSAQTDQARAAYDASVALYRQTVLTAFQGVEDNLAALRILAEETHVQDQALQAARQVVVVTTNQYQAGTVAYINVLVFQAVALSNERACLDLLSRRLAASVSLVKALGGGWHAKQTKSQ